MGQCNLRSSHSLSTIMMTTGVAGIPILLLMLITTDASQAQLQSEPADVINIEMLHNHFNQCDTNQDGKLARDECASHWEGGNGPTFDEVDEDGDGEVSWEEMKKAATTMRLEESGISPQDRKASAAGAAASAAFNSIFSLLDSLSESYKETSDFICFWNERKARDQKACIQKTYANGRFSHPRRTWGIKNGNWYCTLKNQAARNYGTTLDTSSTCTRAGRPWGPKPPMPRCIKCTHWFACTTCCNEFDQCIGCDNWWGTCWTCCK